MSFLDKWVSFIEKTKKLDERALESLKIAIFIVIIANIFGVWYLLGWKKLAIFILIMSIFGLVVILMLLRNKKEVTKKMNKEDKKKEDSEEVEEYLDLTNEDFKEEDDFGLPNSDEFQKRLDKAIGI